MKPGQVIVTNSLAGLSAAGGQPATQASPIERAIQQIENELSMLHDSLETLYARLQPYSTSQDTKNTSNPPNSSIGNSPAVVKLSEIGDRIARMNATTHIIRERLEL